MRGQVRTPPRGAPRLAPALLRRCRSNAAPGRPKRDARLALVRLLLLVGFRVGGGVGLRLDLAPFLLQPRRAFAGGVLRVLDEVALGFLEPLLLAAAGFAHGPHRFVVPFHGGGLPLSEAREAPADNRAVTQQEAPERPMRILLAEDSDASRFMLQRAVESLGHECVAAEDGLAAWQAFQAADPEVVISDWLMPGIDGDEL